MKIKLIGACLIVFLLAVLLLSNTVSAEAVVGPPIGEQVVEFDPSDTVLPDASVTVTIKWWITNESYKYYKGPFNLHMELKDSKGREIADWTEHIYNYWPEESYPPTDPPTYIYSFPKNAPSGIGTYFFDVQIVVVDDELKREVGKSGNYHPFLVASGEGTLTTVPEFTTIAIPVAAILGLLFFFNHRKRRKEVIKKK